MGGTDGVGGGANGGERRCAAPIWIGMRGRDEGGSGGEWERGIGLGFRGGDKEREWAGQLVGPGLLGRSPGVLFFFFF